MYIDSYGRIVASDELMHFGILGMRWGIRRFQPYPSNYRGDGKFTGDKSSGSKKSTALESKASASATKTRTGYKELDNVVNFAEKNKIANKWNPDKNAGESAAIGFKALPDDVRTKSEKDDFDNDSSFRKSMMDWFVYEDQTIGFYEIADLAMQGKSVSEIENIVKESAKILEPTYGIDTDKTKAVDKVAGTGTYESVTDLKEFNNYYLSSSRESWQKEGKQYIKNCVEEAQKRKGLQHGLKLVVNNFGELVYDDELYHHGILGMRWGIRRFQPYPKGHSSDGKFVGKTPKKEKPKKEPKTMTYEEFVAKQRKKEIAKKMVKRALFTVGSMAVATGVRYVFAQAGIPIVPGKRVKLRGYDENFENLKKFFETKDPKLLWNFDGELLPTHVKTKNGGEMWRVGRDTNTYIPDLGYTYKPKLPDEDVLNKWKKWSP